MLSFGAHYDGTTMTFTVFGRVLAPTDIDAIPGPGPSNLLYGPGTYVLTDDGTDSTISIPTPTDVYGTWIFEIFGCFYNYVFTH